MIAQSKFSRIRDRIDISAIFEPYSDKNSNVALNALNEELDQPSFISLEKV